MDTQWGQHLARNIRQIRQLRGLTQQQLATLSGIPRPTLSNLETGGANPTLSVLVQLASVLNISVEELISRPRSTTRHYKTGQIEEKRKGRVKIRKLLPDSLGGLELDRMEIPPGERMIGTPHKVGTREYLCCEAGRIELTVAGENYILNVGEVIVFRGDQRHSYFNPTRQSAVGYSVILVGPTVT